jgi:hypothetical protein
VIRHIPVLRIALWDLRTALIRAKESSEIEIQEAVAVAERAVTGRLILDLIAGIDKLCASVGISSALRVD